MAPIGGDTVDSGLGCRECGVWATTETGMHLGDPHPLWLPVIAAVVGASIGVLAAILIRRLLVLRRSKLED